MTDPATAAPTATPFAGSSTDYLVTLAHDVLAELRRRAALAEAMSHIARRDAGLVEAIHDAALWVD